MQVNLSFDTEKDSAEDFKQLLDYIKKILDEKESGSPLEFNPPQPKRCADAPAKERTNGGCRVVPYEDLTDTLFSLCSKKR